LGERLFYAKENDVVRGGVDGSEGSAPGLAHMQIRKSLLLLFFRKEDFLLYSNP
jgi:hypothetical protein